MLLVGLNLLFLIPGETGGMETAARETIPHLAAIDDLRLTLFVNREAAGTFGGAAEEVVVPVNATSRIQWVRGEQQHIPTLATRHGCQIVHSLGSTAPLRGAFRRVTTIHDLNYRKVPESHFGLRGLGMRALVPAAARRSDRIIVDAASTRDDLHDLLKIDPSMVDVVPLGVTAPTGPAIPTGELRSALDLPDGPVVLCPGAKRPHKNAHGVIEAAGVDGEPADGHRDWLQLAIRAAPARASGRAWGPPADAQLPRQGRSRWPLRAGFLRRRRFVLRGLRPAGARGDGARRAGRGLEPRLPA